MAAILELRDLVVSVPPHPGHTRVSSGRDPTAFTAVKVYRVPATALARETGDRPSPLSAMGYLRRAGEL